MENQIYLEERRCSAQIIRKVSICTLTVNIFLTALQAVFGLIFFNVSVLSDTVHSLSDVGTTVLVIISAAVATPHADKEHNYGHEKRESVIVLFFSLILGATGVLLLVQGILGFTNIQEVVSVSPFLLGVVVFTIISKEALFWYTMHYAKKTHSGALKADAWHHRSDSFSSVAVLIGLICSIFIKTNLAESIAVVVVALLIVKVAFDILKSSISQLTDKAADEKTCAAITAAASQIEGVESIDRLKTRLFGSAIYVDIEIGVVGTLSVGEAHVIADKVHDAIEVLPKLSVKHCNVHVNPAE